MPAPFLIRLSEQAPEPEDVTAGALGGLVFVLLVVAVALLMLSFLKQMRKADQAKRDGVYGDEPTQDPGLPQSQLKPPSADDA